MAIFLHRALSSPGHDEHRKVAELSQRKADCLLARPLHRSLWSQRLQDCPRVLPADGVRQLDTLVALPKQLRYVDLQAPGCRLMRCSNASRDLRLREAPPHHLVGQAIVDTVGHSTRSGCQFVGAVEPDQHIERK